MRSENLTMYMVVFLPFLKKMAVFLSTELIVRALASYFIVIKYYLCLIILL